MAPTRTIEALRSSPSTALVVGDVWYRVAMGAYWILVARTLAPSDVGLLALGNALSVPTFTLLDAGFAQYAVRECVPRHHGGSLPEEVMQAVQRRPLLAIVGVGVVTLAGGVMTGSAEGTAVCAALGLSYAFDYVLQVQLVSWRARLDMTADLSVKAWQSTATVALVALLIRLADGGTAVVVIALASPVVYLVANLGVLVMQSQMDVHQVKEPAPPSGVLERLTTGRGAFASVAILIAIYTRVDALAVQVALGSGALAVYTIVFRVVEAGRIVPWAIGRVVLASASSPTARAQANVARYREVSCLLGLGATSAIVALGPLAVSFLFGRFYADEGTAVMYLLALTVATVSFTGPLLSELLASGREAAVVRRLLLVLAITLVVVPPAAVHFGLAGVAGGVLLGEVVAVAAFGQQSRSARQVLRRPPFLMMFAVLATTVIGASITEPYSSIRPVMAVAVGLLTLVSLRLSAAAQVAS